jgi:hypothetical protein
VIEEHIQHSASDRLGSKSWQIVRYNNHFMGREDWRIDEEEWGKR